MNSRFSLNKINLYIYDLFCDKMKGKNIKTLSL